MEENTSECSINTLNKADKATYYIPTTPGSRGRKIHNPHQRGSQSCFGTLKWNQSPGSYKTQADLIKMCFKKTLKSCIRCASEKNLLCRRWKYKILEINQILSATYQDGFWFQFEAVNDSSYLTIMICADCDSPMDRRTIHGWWATKWKEGSCALSGRCFFRLSKILKTK